MFRLAHSNNFVVALENGMFAIEDAAGNRLYRGEFHTAYAARIHINRIEANE